MMGIYEIINLADGKMTSYVGSSVDVKRRWKDHIRLLRDGRHRNPRLQAAWDKYGEGAFSFCVLERVADEENLLDCEQCYLDRAFGVGDTYNIARDATAPMLGRVFTMEHRRKIGEANAGREFSEEHKRKLSKARMGRAVTTETGHKISRALMGHEISAKTKHKIGKANARPYPAFRHRETGEVIPAGVNLSAICRDYGLGISHMCAVKNGRLSHCQGWELL